MYVQAVETSPRIEGLDHGIVRRRAAPTEIEDHAIGVPSVDRANPAINRHRKTGHFLAVIETEKFYCESAS